MTSSPKGSEDQTTILLGAPSAEQLHRLRQIRDAIRRERARAITPAVKRALELTETQLFLAMTYLGYTDQLFPEEEP